MLTPARISMPSYGAPRVRAAKTYWHATFQGPILSGACVTSAAEVGMAAMGKIG
jgi:hypothetical protein